MAAMFSYRLMFVVLTVSMMLGTGRFVVAAEREPEHEPEHAPEHEPDHESDMARTAVERGEAAPLREIFKIVAKKFPGEVVNVSLTRRGEFFIYHIKLLDEENRLFEVLVNARTGLIISVSGP